MRQLESWARSPPDRPAAQRLPRIAAAALRGLGIPGAPSHGRKASLVGRERSPGLPLIGGDDVLRLPDFLLEFGNGLLCLADPARLRRLTHREPRGFDVLQGLAKLPELGAMPRNGAVAVYRHANSPDSQPNLARIGQVGPREGTDGASRPPVSQGTIGPFPISAPFCHRSDRRRAFKQQTCMAICA